MSSTTGRARANTRAPSMFYFLNKLEECLQLSQPSHIVVLSVSTTESSISTHTDLYACARLTFVALGCRVPPAVFWLLCLPIQINGTMCRLLQCFDYSATGRGVNQQQCSVHVYICSIVSCSSCRVLARAPCNTVGKSADSWSVFTILQLFLLQCFGWGALQYCALQWSNVQTIVLQLVDVGYCCVLLHSVIFLLQTGLPCTIVQKKAKYKLLQCSYNSAVGASFSGGALQFQLGLSAGRTTVSYQKALHCAWIEMSS